MVTAPCTTKIIRGSAVSFSAAPPLSESSNRLNTGGMLCAALLALHRLPADVAAAEALRPFDPVDRLIGEPLRRAHGLGHRRDIEHAAAVGENLAAVGLGAGVENFRALHLSGRVEPLDQRAALVVAGIALGR